MKVLIALILTVGVALGYTKNSAPEAAVRHSGNADWLHENVIEIQKRALDGTLHIFTLYRGADGAPLLFVTRTASPVTFGGEIFIETEVVRRRADSVSLEAGEAVRVAGRAHVLVVQPVSGGWHTVDADEDVRFEFVPK